MMRIRYILLIFFIISLAYYDLSILFSDEGFFQSKKIKLGLDIKGGSYIRLKIDHKFAMNEYLYDLRGNIETELEEKNIDFASVKYDGYNNVIIKLNDLNSKKRIDKILSDLNKDFKIVHENRNIIITPKGSFLAYHAKEIMENTIESIRRRVDAIGTNEAQISHQGLNYISVQVPGIDNPDKLRAIIGKNAKLSFHLFADDDTEGDSTIIKDKLDNKYKIKKNPEMSGDILKKTTVTYDRMGEPVISFFMNSKASDRFAYITKHNVGKPLVIVLDDVVLTAPVIKEPVIAGKGEIKGSFTNEEVSELALLLRSGSLPAPLKIEEEKMIGATLGDDIIKYGIESAIVALIAVGLCMIFTYRIFGIFSVIALTINLMIMLCIVSVLGITVTLPGISGMILTIGMSVDNNILIFERIKEINMEYKDMTYSVRRGFTYAKSAIFDANITTMIAAVMMFIIGVSTVKGFAIMLSLGILSSMFSSLFITYSLICIWNGIRSYS
ncbi:protein translocase subunit SecD [Anaplasmataceae bacterium AB001_6]|nr:protein translocase subunit SecD [Anaplasmataceae bacterium AB001_6]